MNDINGLRRGMYRNMPITVEVGLSMALVLIPVLIQFLLYGRPMQSVNDSTLRKGLSASIPKAVCLFPTFDMQYRDFNPAGISGFGSLRGHYLARARRILTIDPAITTDSYVSVKNSPKIDQLQRQLLCYIDNCAISTVLKNGNIGTDRVAGYSMGLHSALYHCECFTFEDGLRIVEIIFNAARHTVQAGSYGMATAVGLNRNSLNMEMRAQGIQLEIGNEVLETVLLVSGEHSAIEQLEKIGRRIGLQRVTALPLGIPYHSNILKPAGAMIQSRLDQIDVCAPRHQLVSSIDQSLIKTAAAVREEIRAIVHTPVSWYKTLVRILSSPVDLIIECGLSDKLGYIARILHSDVTTVHPKLFARHFHLANGS